MYGAQTKEINVDLGKLFENDVEMYGAQTVYERNQNRVSLRMM